VIFVLLPAYNEEEGLPPLLEAYADLATTLPDSLEIVVVDDGSSDQTSKVASSFSNRLDMTVIKHEQNKGLGAAFLTGFQYIADTGGPEDVVVTMDADNTHAPRFIAAMLATLRYSDVVIASRYAPGGKELGVPPHRRLLSRGASILYRTVFGISGVTDYTCGYRMYRLKVIQDALEYYGDDFVTEKGFSSTGEILLKLLPIAEDFAEVPFQLRYDLKAGVSKMPKFKTVINTLRLLVKLRRIVVQTRNSK